MLIYKCFKFTKEDYEIVRTESSVKIHRTLLGLENFMRGKNYPLVTSFIGGSCKLCKEGCPPDGCNLPHLARIPIEATGINLISSLKKIDIDIKFPVKDEICRYGILLWW